MKRGCSVWVVVAREEAFWRPGIDRSLETIWTVSSGKARALIVRVVTASAKRVESEVRMMAFLRPHTGGWNLEAELNNVGTP